jgi:transcriptional regulator with XRE-family HTH domain
MFADRLKQLRELKGMSQKEFADDIDATQQTVSRWESGTYEADFDTLIKISKYFSVSIDYLLGIDKLNEEDLKDIETLKSLLIKKGIMSKDHDMTKDEFEKAIDILKALLPIIKE